MFNPKTEYNVTQDVIYIKDFYDYAEDYVVRPPYQRKSVWSARKQRSLLDSLFRRYYVPRLVIREVELGENQTKHEVIDGQQRITTVQRFFADELTLPKTLKDVSPALPGKRYSDLPVDIRKFVDKSLKYEADIVHGIEHPRNPAHQKIATEIFWRLQQGESLNYMEEAHARLSSLARNFVVKYADDITFDFDAYEPRDQNPDKHPFFSLLNRKNDRMQHLALLVRLLLFEEAGGPTDIQNIHIQDYIDEHQVPDGVGNLSFEGTGPAREVLANMRAFSKVFEEDPSRGAAGGVVPELQREYFIISVYLLVRHLRTHYVFGEGERALVRGFVYHFYRLWRSAREAGADRDLLIFSDHRQHSSRDIEIRDQIVRQHFFRFAQERGFHLRGKDSKRAFDEAERIAIYRSGKGLCKACLDEGKPESEARVAWADYEADHVLPHSRGGTTALNNGQILCLYHNRSKGARATSTPDPSAA